MKVGEGADTWGRRGGGSGSDLDALLPPWPLQIILTLRHVFWTAEVHQAICGGTLALQECLARLQVRWVWCGLSNGYGVWCGVFFPLCCSS